MKLIKNKRPSLEDAAKSCLSEVEAVMKRHGFAFLPVPMFVPMQGGGYRVDVDLRIQKLPEAQ